MNDKLYNTEYGFLLYYDDYRSHTVMSDFLKMIATSIENDNFAYLDLKVIKNDFNEDIKYLKLRDKYKRILADSDEEIFYNKEGFHYAKHVFQSLRELEKALKNKAFL